MKNTNPSLREYFGELVPDESVFSYMMQNISIARRKEQNNLDYSVPYYYYDAEIHYDPETNGRKQENSKLLRGYYCIYTTKPISSVCDLIELEWNDSSVNASTEPTQECSEILRHETVYVEPGHYEEVYYVAISCRPGRTIKFKDTNIIWCLGVAF